MLLVERETEIGGLNKVLCDALNEVEGAQDGDRKLQAELSKRESDLEEAKHLMVARGSDIEHLTEKIETLEDKLHYESADLADERAEVSKLEQKLSMLETTLDDANKLLKHREDKTNEYDLENADLLEKFRAGETEIGSLKAELLSTRASALDKETQLEKLNEKIQNLENKVKIGQRGIKLLMRKF